MSTLFSAEIRNVYLDVYLVSTLCLPSVYLGANTTLTDASIHPPRWTLPSIHRD